MISMADRAEQGRQGFEGRAVLHNPSKLTTDFETVWSLHDEMCPSGSANLVTLGSPELTETYVETAWLLQALLEFQDLQEITITLATPLPNNSKYFFFEALSAMREVVVTGCNGSFHASLALLRTFIELILFHFWWQDRLNRDDKAWLTFHAWVRGEWTSPPLRSVLRDVYTGLRRAPNAAEQAELEHYYKILCSYAHKPLIRESLTYLKGNNARVASPTVLGFWLRVLNGVAKIIVDLMIAEKPMSLFPVQPYQKFGFNYPIGLYFDQFNSVPLMHALGEPKLTDYRTFYGALPEVEDLLSYFNGQQSMSDDQILQTWNKNKDMPEDPGMSTSERILHLWAALKAESRALHWFFAYGEFADMPLPNLEE
jgi:hypothetical protein